MYRVPGPLPRPGLVRDAGGELDDGASVPGFLTDPGGVDAAQDITPFGSWRAHLAGSAAVLVSARAPSEAGVFVTRCWREYA